jgi:hypothetical protein
MHGQQNIKLYHNIYKSLLDNTQHFQKTDIQASEGFERAIPAGEKRQTHALTARQPRSKIN